MADETEKKKDVTEAETILWTGAHAREMKASLAKLLEEKLKTQPPQSRE